MEKITIKMDIWVQAPSREWMKQFVREDELERWLMLDKAVREDKTAISFSEPEVFYENGED